VFAIELWWEGANKRRITVLPIVADNNRTFTNRAGDWCRRVIQTRLTGKISAGAQWSDALTEDMSSNLAEPNHVEQTGSKQREHHALKAQKARERTSI
jgi:hypothetical protein